MWVGSKSLGLYIYVGDEDLDANPPYIGSLGGSIKIEALKQLGLIIKKLCSINFVTIYPASIQCHTTED